MSIELKIKSKHLSLEAKVIRHEEHKLKQQIRWMASRQALPPYYTEKYQSIHNHRVWDVRNENRATFLARAYLQGRPYNTIEHKRKDDVVFRAYILPRMFEMVNKYGPSKDRIHKKWMERYKGADSKVYKYDTKELEFAMDKLVEWSTLDIH